MAKHHGTMTFADLKAHRTVERTPLRGAYRGHDLVTMAPPSSGDIVLHPDGPESADWRLAD